MALSTKLILDSVALDLHNQVILMLQATDQQDVHMKNVHKKWMHHYLQLLIKKIKWHWLQPELLDF